MSRRRKYEISILYGAPYLETEQVLWNGMRLDF
jgi:hypothetical protein